MLYRLCNCEGLSMIPLQPMQCRHLIPALNVWSAQAYNTTTRPFAAQFQGRGCMNDLKMNVVMIRNLRGL